MGNYIPLYHFKSDEVKKLEDKYSDDFSVSEDIEEDLDSFLNSALDDNNDNFTQEYSPILEVLINNYQVLKTYARDKIMGLGILKISFVEIIVLPGGST